MLYVTMNLMLLMITLLAERKEDLCFYCRCHNLCMKGDVNREGERERDTCFIRYVQRGKL